MRGLLLLLALWAIIQLSHAQTCVPAAQFRFKSSNGLYANGVPISIKGANWWGAETRSFAPGGLWSQSIDSLLAFMQRNGFNGIRLPFALDVALNADRRYPNNINYGVNPDLQGLTTIQVFEKIFEKAAARGIIILLDQHRFDGSEVNSAPRWFSTECITNVDGVCKWYTIEDDKNGWSYMVNRFKKYWNFFGIDLINEPHGAARWATGLADNDWALASAEIGNYVINQHPDWHGMILVEGVEKNPTCQILGCGECPNDGHWWGGSFEGIRCATVNLQDQNRLVYSPHIYGNSIFHQPYYDDPNFPNNLEYIFDTHFGFAINQTGRAFVIGEWGGYYTGLDKQIQDYQAAYFKRRGITSTFYWALNPNPGGDTDGILNEDWVTPNAAKVAFLAGAHPTPSTFSASNGQICVSGYAGPSNPTTIAPVTTTAPAVTTTQSPSTGTSTSSPSTGASTSTTPAATTTPTTPGTGSGSGSGSGSTTTPTTPGTGSGSGSGSGNGGSTSTTAPPTSGGDIPGQVTGGSTVTQGPPSVPTDSATGEGVTPSASARALPLLALLGAALLAVLIL